MTFELPWMLLGLATLAIPLWFHLRPRREEALRFPAVALLRRVALVRSPRLRLRNLLLLLARLAAVVALVLAAAQPGLTVTRPGGIRSGLALALVIVLDDSLSMRQRDTGGTTAFAGARDLARAELDRLRPGDAAALVLSGQPARTVVEEVEFDLDLTRKAIAEARAGYRSGDIEGALRTAARLLEDSPLPQREVVLITDLGESDWAPRGFPWTAESGIGFRAIAAVDGPVPENATVDQVRVAPSSEGITREFEIEARIANFGKRAQNGVDVVLEIEGQEAARARVDVPPAGSTVKRFHHRFGEEGAQRGLIRIPADALAADDVRHFTVMIRRALGVLVIDGDYRPGSYRDEAFYLQRALETATPGEVPIESAVSDLELARSSPLTEHDVIFLVGVDQVPIDLAERLTAFVRAGGGLFVAPGARGSTLEQLEGILPGTVRSVRRARRAAKPFGIGAVNRAHPVFSSFGEGPTGLEGVGVESHLLVEPDPGAERSIVVELKGGLPLLLERRVGKGAVMLLTTTLDRDWTDLPIRPGYLPLVQRATRHLAGRLGEREPRRVTVGGGIDLEVSPGMRRLVVQGPTGAESSFAGVELAGRSSLRYTATELPGAYRVWAEVPGVGGLRELDGSGFVVEFDAAESDLTRRAEVTPDDDAAIFAAVEGRLPIWPYLLFAAVMLLLAESWIAGTGLRRSHI